MPPKLLSLKVKLQFTSSTLQSLSLLPPTIPHETAHDAQFGT